MCDLAFGLLTSKTVNFELKEFPADINMPAMFLVKEDDPAFVNTVSYLPPELAAKAPKKSGICISYIPVQKMPAGLKKIKVRNLLERVNCVDNLPFQPGAGGPTTIIEVSTEPFEDGEANADHQVLIVQECK